MLLLGFKSVLKAPDCPPRAAQSNTAREVLRLLLEKANIPSADIKNDANGRPYLADNPLVDFSISHTPTHAFCLLSTASNTKQPLRVGVDAEPLDTTRSTAKCQALAKRFFAPNEQLLLLDAIDLKRAFLEIFTKKEAFAKFTGSGLSKSLTNLDTASEDFSRQHGARFFTSIIADHVVTVCTPKEAAPDIQILSF